MESMRPQKQTRYPDKVVYLLGAGFSAPLGIPVTSNFLEKSKDIFASEPESYPHFANVFKTIDSMHKAKGYYNADLFNVEEILSILEMNEELGSDSEKSSFVQYIIDVIKYFTPSFQPYKIPGRWQHVIFGESKEQRLINYYGYFTGTLLNLVVSRNNSGDFFCNRYSSSNREFIYSVVTLNYDLVLENCFSYLVEHFHAEKEHGFFRECEEDLRQFDVHTHLAKLHGTVDAETIVPPTWNKGLQGNIRPAWRLAYKLLTEANHIRIIGYSLPLADAYVKYLLKAAIIRCERLKTIDVLCLDPDNSIGARYNQFICYPNYRFRKGNVEDYLLDNYAACVNQNNGAPGLHFNGLESTHKKYFD